MAFGDLRIVPFAPNENMKPLRPLTAEHSCNVLPKTLKVFICGALLLPLAGCTDGPFFHLKKLNPYIQSQWRKDREKAVVFSQRVEEIRLLRSQIARMPEEEQRQWIEKLDSMLKTETSPELKRESLLALQQVIGRAEAVSAITPLIRDKNLKVRITVAEVLRSPDAASNPEASSALLAMASSDASDQARQAATRSLGMYRSEEVKKFLASKLEDKSPAMQREASLALKDLTGRDYGGDIDAWQRYVNGEDVPEPKTSIADSLRSVIPTWR